MFRCYCILCSILAAALAWLVLASVVPSAYSQEAKISFIRDVAPILKENCFACHDAKRKKGKLDMTTFESFRKGGTKDDPVTAGKPRESLIIDVLTSTGPEHMPPKENGDPLTKQQVTIISQWIAAGAQMDAGIDPKADLLRELRVRWKAPAPPASYPFPFLINALAFTPDGKKIVVGGYHELTVWDPLEARLEKRIYTRAERAKAMAFLPDGKLAVAGGRPGQEGDVRIYDISGTGTAIGGVGVLDGVNDKSVLVAELYEGDDEVLALAVSPDGTKLAAGGCDRLVRVWDVASRALDQVVENHADWVLGVAFSPDNKLLLTASRDKTAKIWDLAAKESVLTFGDHQNSVYGVGILPDGKTGFSVGEDGNLREWQATDDKKQIGKQTRSISGGKAVYKVTYYPSDEKALFATCGADGAVRLFNAKTGAALKNLAGFSDYVFAVAISPDGQWVAGGGNNGEVRIWQTSDGAPVKDFIAAPGHVAAKK